jgi:hypothetical protein
MLFNLKRYLEETPLETTRQENFIYKISTVLLIILLFPFISIPVFVLFYSYVKNLQIQESIIKAILTYIVCGILFYGSIKYIKYNN